ncbi:MAG: hypothetical protein IT580_08580 [Verrucomicrobiales bacterium]|nr:hypothetical protein [Verrucomicrobiales bacterium]
MKATRHWQGGVPARYSTLISLAMVLLVGVGRAEAGNEFRAGAAAVEASPQAFPVLINGGMLSQSATNVRTPIMVRALVFAMGSTQVAVVVVDSCMMSRVFLDDVKARAAGVTGISASRMLISATHTHSAPATMGCLGTEADPRYLPVLRERIVESMRAAQRHLEPARVGYGVIDAASFTAPRQWIRRPDRVVEDPFGNRTVRANMHAAANWDDVTGEAGPEDPDLSLVSVQAMDGRPLAVLGNFSMHYFSDAPVSADYFGLFSEGLKRRLAATTAEGYPPFVGLLSHGCSGDIWRRDYTRPAAEWDPNLSMASYTEGLLDLAVKAQSGIRHEVPAELGMEEQRVTLRYRVPDRQRLEWARRIVDGMGDRGPKDTTEVYAREQVLLHDAQQTEVVVQAVRVGSIGIVALPTETYAITGLKLKAASPLAQTMVIELANGGDGYVPPPEQHPLGGYNTWAARSAGLEVTAEPKLVGTALSLLETVTRAARRPVRASRGSAARRVAELRPVAWWRLDEFQGPRAADASSHGRDAIYEPGVTFYLEGPASAAFCEAGEKNRAAHFAGGRLRAVMPSLGERYTVSLWAWNGMPTEGRGVTGWLCSVGPDHGWSAWSEHLGLGGAAAHAGRLVFLSGEPGATLVAGRTVIPRWSWQHVAMTREPGRVRMFLNGGLELEAPSSRLTGGAQHPWFLGGRCDGQDSWEGRLDEIAVFDRVLSDAELRALARVERDSGTSR